MKETFRKLFDKVKPAFGFLTNKKATKGASITYQVIWNLLLLLMITAVLGTAFAGAAGAGYFASLVKDEPIRSYDKMHKDIYNYEETSQLYFADDVYLGKLRTDLDREEIKLENVSDHVKNAVIATEDEYFYEHDGVVPKAILRALFQEVTNSANQSGGSTLTQQLIKNQILTNEVSFDRKAKEILLALRLEQFFEKEEILEAYLNVSTFGRNAEGRNIAGIQAAAKGIFGVEAKDLSLPQAAFIAGLPQSPFGYTPFMQGGGLKDEAGIQPGVNRMKTVLNRMHSDGQIDKEQYDSAINHDIVADFKTKKDADPLEKYPYLTVEVEERAKDIMMGILAEQDGYEEKDLEADDELKQEYKTLADRAIRQKGYKIHTTIDKKIYDAMQKVKDDYPNYGPDKPQMKVVDGKEQEVTEQVQVGAVLIENSTGKIISFVGGRDHKSEATNHATRSIRPNGSTMKPLLIYAPAMEMGKAQPGTILPDVPLYLHPGLNRPWPYNYTMTYNGLVSARYALEMSYNVPAVKLYKDIVGQRPATYLEKMGFTSLVDVDYTNLAASIGSLEHGVSVEENTNAYTTFANGGKFVDAYMIEKITDKEGNPIFEHKVEPNDVFSPQTAYLTLDMMRGVLNSGTATSVKSRLKFGSDWAGKTGTGNNFEDSWFVASNPNVTFGIWTGYDTPKSLKTGGLNYSLRTNYLWADLMNAAYDINPKLVDPSESFKRPDGIVSRSFCAISGLLPSEACSKAGLVDTDLFNAKFVPTQVDKSLGTGRLVRIGEKKYLALESTPEEFSEPGMVLDPDYIEQLFGIKANPSDLIPKRDRWANVLVAADKLSENGKVPGAPGIKESGSSISWGKHPESDVIGYRVYKDGKKVGSVKAGDSLSFKAANGKYHVTAVDIAGKESSSSNVIELGKKEVEAKDKDQNTEEKPKTEDKPKKEEKPKDDKPTNKPKPEEPKDDKKEENPPSDEDNDE
ncbi:transglycosylase domain-containing protein [Cytobacillus purgationiresistens]|uniref:Penicillin-binding protein n=1 Tax=Cytobacillus purgationiresistens TaxID=863449 RepID=A0ABU0ALJ1_9BACI|nr:transglycosylase domain-containing protein [Cytobacillus purgationiresistens]MDQ0272138.1 penicillin-binding protein [Cytobacillus purgationiresistens]